MRELRPASPPVSRSATRFGLALVTTLPTRKLRYSSSRLGARKERPTDANAVSELVMEIAYRRSRVEGSLVAVGKKRRYGLYAAHDRRGDFVSILIRPVIQARAYREHQLRRKAKAILAVNADGALRAAIVDIRRGIPRCLRHFLVVATYPLRVHACQQHLPAAGGARPQDG